MNQKSSLQERGGANPMCSSTNRKGIPSCLEISPRVPSSE